MSVVQAKMASDKEVVTSLFSTVYNRHYGMFLFIHLSAGNFNYEMDLMLCNPFFCLDVLLS